jgi:hypothetical protein
LKKKDPKLLVFETNAVLKRVEKYGDLFAPVLTQKQETPSIRPRVNGARAFAVDWE